MMTRTGYGDEAPSAANGDTPVAGGSGGFSPRSPIGAVEAIPYSALGTPDPVLIAVPSSAAPRAAERSGIVANVPGHKDDADPVLIAPTGQPAPGTATPTPTRSRTIGAEDTPHSVILDDGGRDISTNARIVVYLSWAVGIAAGLAALYFIVGTFRKRD
jgi:hypothetical protein